MIPSRPAAPGVAGVVVVGASAAGVSAAVGLRDAGFTGPLTVVGAEPHPPYDRPAVSKGLLTDLEPAPPPTLPAVDAVDARWLLGRSATALDLASRTVRLDDGTTLPYDGLVLATGAEAAPARAGLAALRSGVRTDRPSTCGVPALPSAPTGTAGPTVPAPTVPAVRTLRTWEDAAALRQVLDAGATRVVVVGGGFVGTEVAAACRRRGAEVTLVDRGESLLARRCGPLVGEVLAALHREHGVRLALRTEVAALRPAPGSTRDRGATEVVLADGRTLLADVVVAGLGARPATGWLAGSGLDVGDGVRCDETCLAAPGVVAAGDLCRWPSRTFGRELRVEHWTNAVEQGEYAGRRLHAALTGAPAPPPYDPVPSFWTEQFGCLVQVLGRPEPGDEVRVVAGDPRVRRFVAVHGRAGVVRAVVGIDWPARLRRLRPLVATAAPWSVAVVGAA